MTLDTALMGVILQSTNPSKLAQEFKVGTGTVREVVAQAQALYSVGQKVKILHTSYAGIVTGFNTSDFGIYTGDRFPVHVKITEIQSDRKDALGSIFEYGLLQIQDFEEYAKTPRWFAIYGYKSLSKGAEYPLDRVREIAGAAGQELLHHKGTHVEFIRIPKDAEEREIVEGMMNEASLHWELVGEVFGV